MLNEATKAGTIDSTRDLTHNEAANIGLDWLGSAARDSDCWNPHALRYASAPGTH